MEADTAGRHRALRLEWRAVALGVLGGLATFEPTFVLRRGGLLCALLFLTNINGFRFRAPDVWAILYTALAVSSLLWAYSAEDSLIAAKNQLACLAIFLAARSIVRSRGAFLTIAVGCIAGCSYALWLLYRQNAGARFVVHLSAQRYGIEGLNYNYLAYALATVAVLVVVLWTNLQHRSGRATLLLVAIAALLYWGISQSGTRGALLALILLTGWVLLCRARPTVRLRWLCLGIATLAGTIFFGFSDSLLEPLGTGTALSTDNLSGRLSVWPIARSVFEDHPLIGVGIGGFRSVNPYGIGTHNGFLEIGTGLGILGLSLFTATVIAALVTGTRNADHSARSLYVGSILIVSAPIFLSGQWDQSPVAWLALALFSRVAVLHAPRLTRVAPALEHGLGPSPPPRRNLTLAKDRNSR